MDFEEFFFRATKYAPYPYQRRLADAGLLPTVLLAPTAAGKTEAAILAGWLWRRAYSPDPEMRPGTPRRLVYCLPLRTLVEQTAERVTGWLANLGISDRIALTVLFGGQERDGWELYPEKERIVIGTQDMLLSRALNRGYASSPFRWPWEFGLLNNDCLWVLDEVQLMANGLPTSVQLQAFRQHLGAYGRCHSLWMSATLNPKWLRTVDSPSPAPQDVLTPGAADTACDELERRLNATKTLRRLEIAAKGNAYDARQAGARVLELHQPGSMTLVVVNTVQRAQGLHRELQRSEPQAELVLVHSRFRPPDRSAKNERVTARVDASGAGLIVVATQAIEAGVHISARTLITELAPWSSLVQRFGRCNRGGEYIDGAIYWLEVAHKDDREAAPYEAAALSVAAQRLIDLEGESLAPAAIPQYDDEMFHRAVLRRRDLVGLFDTTADLSGGYLDVSRFVRGTDETDVYVFWRSWDAVRPDVAMPAPTRDEVCSVPIGDVKTFLEANSGTRRTAAGATEKETEEVPEDENGTSEQAGTIPSGSQSREAWRWDPLFGQWDRVSAGQVYPGQTLLVKASAGGYTAMRGWDPKSTAAVDELADPRDLAPCESVDGEPSNAGQKRWVPLRDHSLHVRDEARRILEELTELDLPLDVQEAVLTAAHHHDWGKAHAVFRDTMLSNLSPEEVARYGGQLWAKRGKASQRAAKHSRPYFRHEVASALALLTESLPLEDWLRDLAAYLAAAHHGIVRLGMRSLPRARDQSPDSYYLLGFRMLDNLERDERWRQENSLPPADLGDGELCPELLVDVSLAQMGISADDERSWLDRTLDLRDRLGPFRLAYLEALVRAADVAASKAEQQEGGDLPG